MADHAAVINVSRYRPVAGKREELLSAMKRMADQASKAKGCFGAQACRSDADPEEIVAVSRWESRQALEAFSGTADDTANDDQLKALLAGPAQRENLQPV
jgi:quinol monooxygenase YgiN